MLELHGNLDEVRCSDCGETCDRAGVVLPSLPRCESCGALLRPGVVWFGEALPFGVFDAAEAAVRTSDVFLVIGTSAVVYPAAGLVRTARQAGVTVIEVNLEPTPVSGAVDVGLYGKAGEIMPRLISG